ncbi:MAG: 5-(carboxyamino)imidazole ribonucleotide synthase, partial [Casimicrobiaceae bacterium]
MKTQTRLAPGSWLGCLGGGQLGRMFVHAAQRLGYHVCVLDPDGAGPAAQAADETTIAAYDEAAALEQLAARVAAVTTEFENVPAASLELLAGRLPVRPAAQAVAIAQDRRREKRFFAAHGLPVGRFAVIETEADFDALDSALFPGILKTATLGYDGKGQAPVASVEHARLAWSGFNRTPCVLEARLAFDCEISVLAARGADGASAVWPVQENIHTGGILSRTIVPARISPAVGRVAQAVALKLITALDYVGVLAVEFFVVGEQVFVNEIAP